MKRSWMLWLVFAGCGAMVVAAMAWMSLIVLRLEEAGNETRQQALLEENTRLALWRMESMLAPFVAQENARPYYSYQAFFPADRAYTGMLSRLKVNEIRIPSPLLTERSPHVRLYFQLGPAGELSSPQIPDVSYSRQGVEGYSDTGKIEESTQRLKQFSKDVSRQALLAVAPSEWLPVERPNVPGNETARRRKDAGLSAATEKSKVKASLEDTPAVKNDIQPDAESQSVPKTASQARLAQEVMKSSPAQVAKDMVTVPQQQEQQLRNEVEYQARVSSNVILNRIPDQSAESTELPKTSGMDQNKKLSGEKGDKQAGAQNVPTSPQGSDAVPTPQSSTVSQHAEVRISLLKPVWIHDELILIRRVRINQKEYLQGCWLDWPQLQDWLVATVRDLLPQARLEAGKGGNDQARSLAALPIVIRPGQMAASLPALVSPLRFSLWIAWLCVMVAILAIAILFWGTHALSERRAAFVSAVTHELRTPLTTFRIYTEMLAEGMVPDAEQRRQYLNTLKQEADRQYHLIENVLAYSRMERGRYGRQKEIVRLGAWLERIQPSLIELAERSGMTLMLAGEKECGDLQILTDASALDRILFNLVDNACKYARSAADKRIHIEVTPERKKICIRIRDHGPGIDSKDIPRLFQPFHKSANEAANSAPGVGLGLSLCHRLARSIGGELSLDKSYSSGATFSLRLPWVM